MNEQLTADKGKVLKAYTKAKTGRKVFLENLFGLKTFQPDIIKRINSFEDVCKDQNKNPKDYICTSSDPDDIMANATKMALLIARCFNEGKELDWSDDKVRKYLMVLKYSPSSGWSLAGVGGWFTGRVAVPASILQILTTLGELGNYSQKFTKTLTINF